MKNIFVDVDDDIASKNSKDSVKLKSSADSCITEDLLVLSDDDDVAPLDR